MIILRTFADAAQYFDGMATALTIGVFDGVHLGHQLLLRQTIDVANRRNLRSLAITFAEHPLELLAPPYAPKRLTTKAQKLLLLESLGLDVVLELDFSRQLASTEPDDFVSKFLIHACQARAIVSGYDFSFGKNGSGNIELLRRLSNEAGITVEQAEAVTVDGVAVKSTHIRDLVFAGRAEEARKLLTRPHQLTGTVVQGQARGRTIGFPTANLHLHEKLAVPAGGVYFAEAVADGISQSFRAMVNIGISPTFGVNPQTIEAHLMSFSGDITGQQLTIKFLKRLRDEQRFASVADLVEQLKADREACRALSVK